MKLTRSLLCVLSLIYCHDVSAAPLPSGNNTSRSLNFNGGTEVTSDSWHMHVDGGIALTPVEESHDIIVTVASYNISDRATEINFMTPDCAKKLEHTLVGDPYIVDETRIGDFRHFDVRARLNGTELFFGGDGDGIYDVDATGGVVTFCVANSNYMTDQREVKINFLEMAVAIHADMSTSSFALSEIELNRTRMQKQKIDVNFNHLMVAYTCDPNNPTIDIANGTKPIVYSQGSTISLCISGGDPLEGGIHADHIEQLTISQERKDGMETEFNYIRNDTEIPELVLFYPTNELNILVVTIQLVAVFFEEARPLPLRISGNVFLSFNTGRKLGQLDLMTEKKKEPFTMLVQLNADDNLGVSASSTPVANGVFASTVAFGMVTVVTLLM